MKNLFSLKLIQSFAKPAMFVKSGGVQLMLLISMLLIFSSQQLSAQNAGFNSSFPVFSVNGSDASYCMFSNTPCGANGALDGANLGTFIRGANTLRLRGAEHNVWKCGSADILGTFINYRVYPTGSPSGSFNERSIDFISSDGSFSNNNGCGGADQRWKDVQENIDLLGSLPSGNYTIEIYSRITTNLSFPGDRFLNNNNNSNNYRAYFTIADAGFNSSFAVFGINGSNSSYCMLSNTTCGSNGILNGATLGSFVHNSGNLILKGAEHNVFKCFTANITATALNYRVYPAGNASGSYTPVGIDFITGDGSFSNTNGCGGADQRWRDVQENINLTTLTPGNYTIEIYSELTTNGGARFLSNSGANYKANFTISPAPVDCVVSAWGEWSAWSTEACGAEATRTRTRTVVTPASNGGTACPVLEETETRTNAPCPVDCVVSAWGEWSAWSTEACGAEATRTRTRTVVTPASNGGTACPVLEETETRTNAPCPVDCVVSAWGEWSAWSTEACGAEATRTRTRVVVTPAANGGAECGPLTETETRTNAACPVDCVVSAWGEWSAWSTEACGAEATRTRTRTVLTPAANGGAECGPLTETETRTNAPCPGEFITKWDLSKSGSGPTQLSIGTATSGTVSYSWQELPTGLSGSGTFSGTTLAISGLPSGKTIRLSISPTNFQRINISNGADRSKLLDVEKWGSTVWTSMQGAFFGCNNLNITATDIPVLSSCTNMNDMFQSCSNLTGPANINSWNTATVTGMVSMFFNASKFNQNIGNWTLNAGVSMTNMLSNSGMDCSNYAATLIGWNANPLTPNGRTLGALGRTYGPQAIAARANLDGPKGWTFTGGDALDNSCGGAFVTRWNLATAGTGTNQLSFGTATSGTVTYYWQEVSPGTATGTGTFSGNNLTITGLPTGATIRLFIMPTNFQRFRISNTIEGRRLLDVEKWGTTVWTSMNDAFFGCHNLNITATDIPNLTSCTRMEQMFQNCFSLTTVPNINSWNTSAVIYTTSMFNGAKLFNQNIGNWNTSSVIGMVRMFMNANSFNQDISGWNTASVGSMLDMFNLATSFNQNIGNWNTAAVTNMSGMFKWAISFNQNLGNWSLNANVNLSNMLDNSGMDCSKYAATLTGWNANPSTPNNRTLGALGRTYPTSAARANLVGAKGWTITGDAVSSNSCGAFITRWSLAPGATTLSFGTATGGTVSYNWESIPSGFSGSGTFTGNTLNITGLPSGATIRLEINPTNFQRINIGNGAAATRLLDVEKWGTTVWTSMQSAFFGCNKLNITATDIPNLSSCTNMNDMFQGCSSLIGPANINSWNTATVTGMVSMFFNASKFNQNIGNWTLNANVNMTNMLSNSGMDCSNYSATLIGWSANPLTPNGRTLGATGRTYGAYAAAARTNLDVAKNWTINNDALGSCVAPPAAGIDFTSQPAMNKVIAEPSIWPNPVKNMLNIGINESYRNEKLYLTVTDMKGTVLVSRTVTNGNSAISTAAWSKALYVVTLRSGRDIIMTKKIIKQ